MKATKSGSCDAAAILMKIDAVTPKDTDTRTFAFSPSRDRAMMIDVEISVKTKIHSLYIK
jgi:hypothetical protein